MVPGRGLEPPCLTAQPPQDCVYTNFTIPAFVQARGLEPPSRKTGYGPEPYASANSATPAFYYSVKEILSFCGSGRWVSHPRPLPWQGSVLLLNYARIDNPLWRLPYHSVSHIIAIHFPGHNPRNKNLMKFTKPKNRALIAL